MLYSGMGSLLFEWSFVRVLRSCKKSAGAIILVMLGNRKIEECGGPDVSARACLKYFKTHLESVSISRNSGISLFSLFPLSSSSFFSLSVIWLDYS